MTTLYLIRHAEAEGNVYRRMDGHYNSLITPNGLRQIAALQARFADIAIDACYASDLYRTCKTASAIYIPKGLALQTDPRLREVGVGRWENHPFGELERFEPELLEKFNHDQQHWAVEGSEHWPELTARFEAALRQISADNPGKTVAVFTHGSVLRTFQMRLLLDANIPHCDNTAVSCLHEENGVFSFEFLNDASHLSPELSTLARQKWWRSTGKNQDFNMWYRETEPGCFTALLADRAVGHVRTELTGDGAGQLLDIALAEDCRGRGLGEQLIGCAVCHLRAQGAKTIRVCLPAAEPLSGYFERFGFSRVDASTLARDIAVPSLP